MRYLVIFNLPEEIADFAENAKSAEVVFPYDFRSPRTYVGESDLTLFVKRCRSALKLIYRERIEAVGADPVDSWPGRLVEFSNGNLFRRL